MSKKGDQKAILYAEDEEELKELTAESLEDRGLEVLSAGDGEEALKLFLSNEGRIGAVLTDVVMPKMSGKVLFDKIREKSPDMGFVFVSGYSRKELSEDEGVLPERTKFFSKPFDIEEVATVLTKFMES